MEGIEKRASRIVETERIFFTKRFVAHGEGPDQNEANLYAAFQTGMKTPMGLVGRLPLKSGPNLQFCSVKCAGDGEPFVGFINKGPITLKRPCSDVWLLPPLPTFRLPTLPQGPLA